MIESQLFPSLQKLKFDFFYPTTWDYTVLALNSWIENSHPVSISNFENIVDYLQTHSALNHKNIDATLQLILNALKFEWNLKISAI